MNLNLGQLHPQDRADLSPCDLEQEALAQGWVRYTCAHAATASMVLGGPVGCKASGVCDHDSIRWISRRLERLDLNMQEMASACEVLQDQPSALRLMESLSVCFRVSLATVSAGYSFRKHAPWQLIAGGDNHLVRAYLRSATSVAEKLGWVIEKIGEGSVVACELTLIGQVRSEVQREIQGWASLHRRAPSPTDKYAQSAMRSASALNTSAIEPKVLRSDDIPASLKEPTDVRLNDAGNLPNKPTGSSLVRLIHNALGRPFAVHRPCANDHAECTYAI